MKRTIYLLLTLAFMASQSHAATLPEAKPEEVGMRPIAAQIEKEVRAALEDEKMPGCVVAIARKGQVVYLQAFGSRRVEPSVEPMTIDTVFDMASLTKPVVTATSIMQLVEQGKIDLQNPVSKYLPEFRGHGKETVTVEQLMIHTSGLTPDNALADYTDGWEPAYRKICDLKLLSPPGEKFRYSDVGFLLLGEIVGRVSGQPLDEYASRNLFQSLNMRDTGFNPTDELCQRAATTTKEDDQWLRGTVHDPRARYCGGVAGHAGLFSTAGDMLLYAQAMLDARKSGQDQILQPETLEQMTRPRDAAGSLRGLGWDKKSGYSSNRGAAMTAQAYGHGGFTGTALWIDPGLDLVVLFLSNRVHPHGKGAVNRLAGAIGTIASEACVAEKEPKANAGTKLGIDVLIESGFAELKDRKVGLIANHTSRNKAGVSTAKLLADAPGVELVTIFSPEHGFTGSLDQSEIGDTIDPTTGVRVLSLYGATRKPTPEQLTGIDTLVFDIQDIGCRFYTYISTMGLAMEAAAENDIRFVVLDRPNPLGGKQFEGPLLDDATRSFVGFHSIPVRHGMTIGELAQMMNAERKWGTDLTVIKLQSWTRQQLLFDTGLPWRDTSPNMRSLTQALLYPGIGLLETTNISVGRGTDSPFEIVGAPWVDGTALAAEIQSLNLAGVEVIGVEFTPNASKHERQLCGGVRFLVTDWNAFRSLDLGWGVAVSLRKLYPDDWEIKRLPVLLGNEAIYQQIVDGTSVPQIRGFCENELQQFEDRRKPFLLY